MILEQGCTEEELPFWMYHNKSGRISQTTNSAARVTGRAFYSFNNSAYLEVGAGIAFNNREEKKIFDDEAYAQFSYNWLRITAGRKQREELYNGLSATNENILWSMNARPLPGLQIETSRPITLFRLGDFNEGNIGFEASLNEYFLEKDRHVSNARVHHKSLHLVYNNGEGFKIKSGIQHFAQWGGTSPEHGKQPEGIADYLRIFAGRDGGDNAVSGDQWNVLGNHLGSYELYITKDFRKMEVQLIYNHIFEDGSGSRYDNFPDGRYGIFIDLKEKDRLIESVLYELFYTKNQGQYSTGPHKNDAYFNHYQTYHSGWTYNKRILGVPFMVYDAELNRVVNNKFLAHHFGISGSVGDYYNNYPYKLLASYSRNEGTVERRYNPKQDVFFWGLEMLVYKDFFDINLELGGEYKSDGNPLYGAGISLIKKF